MDDHVFVNDRVDVDKTNNFINSRKFTETHAYSGTKLEYM